MKKTLLSFLIISLFASHTLSLAQCGGTLGINSSVTGFSCYGTRVTISATGLNGGWNYKIYKDSLSVSHVISNSSSANDTLNILPTTKYYVTADSSGCTQKKDSISITVFALPTVSPTANPDSICQGECTQLNCGNGNPNSTYSWHPTSILNSSITCNPIACPVVTTTFTLSVTDVHGCVGSGTVTVVVNPNPVPATIGCNFDTLFASASPDYISYQWYKDTTVIAGATQTYLVINQSGNYSVRVINQYGCRVIAFCNGCCITGIENPQMGNELILYPVPADDKLVITGYSKAGKNILTIQNALGETIYREEIMREEEIINSKYFPSGIYFVEIQNEKEKRIGRFIKD